MAFGRIERLRLHLICFVFPLLTLFHTLTAPHPWWAAPIPVAIIALAGLLDVVAGPERRQPAATLPSWVYDGTLYALIALQLVNVGALLWQVSRLELTPLDLAVMTFVTGSCTGYSAIVVAHELVHRREAHLYQLGRLLLLTALYEHFATEHVRGHHKRIGTPDDPATARHGEWFLAFYARTVPAQLASAWRLESRRLAKKPAWQRLLGHRVLQGLVLGWGLVALLALWSPVVALAMVLQAAWAVTFMESVNYIEHWGLQRQGGRVTVLDSWDTESWWSYYTLVGLTRHADHHAHASRPYQDLRHFEQSIKMPWGYWAMSLGTMFANPVVMRAMDRKLREAGLGPYQGLGTVSQPGS